MLTCSCAEIFVSFPISSAHDAYLHTCKCLVWSSLKMAAVHSTWHSWSLSVALEERRCLTGPRTLLCCQAREERRLFSWLVVRPCVSANPPQKRSPEETAAPARTLFPRPIRPSAQRTGNGMRLLGPSSSSLLATPPTKEYGAHEARRSMVPTKHEGVWCPRSTKAYGAHEARRRMVPTKHEGVWCPRSTKEYGAHEARRSMVPTKHEGVWPPHPASNNTLRLFPDATSACVPSHDCAGAKLDRSQDFVPPKRRSCNSAQIGTTSRVWVLKKRRER
jgi:hypothetical protein